MSGTSAHDVISAYLAGLGADDPGRRADLVISELERCGLIVAPKVPTPEMLAKGCEAGLSLEALLDDTRFSTELAIYTAMIEA